MISNYRPVSNLSFVSKLVKRVAVKQLTDYPESHQLMPLLQSSCLQAPPFNRDCSSEGQRSRSRRDITCAKIRKIINNSAGDCWISLKFGTDFDRVTLDVPRTIKVNGSKVKITA